MGRHRFKTKIKKLNFKRKTLGTILLVAGVFLLGLGLLIPTVLSKKLLNNDISIANVSESIDDNPIQIDESLLKDNDNPEHFPQRVLMPQLGIDVVIDPAKVVNGRWEVYEKVGSYGLGSGVPGTNDNTVVFAHAREGLFLPLKSVEKDMIVYVLTDNEWYQYRVADIKEVFPNDVSVIKPTEDETLTLYTCTGFADSKRLIVSAKRVV